MTRVAVVTEAQSSGFYLPFFIRYYGGLFGMENLYIGQYGEGFATDLQTWNCGPIAANYVMPGPMQEKVSELLKTHDIVIRADADEILVPDPRKWKNLRHFADDFTGDFVTSHGLDVMQMPSDAPLDFSKPILTEQRQFGFGNQIMNKTAFTSVPMKWNGGYHWTNYPPKFGGLFNLHLHSACNKMRSDWCNFLRDRLPVGSHFRRYHTGQISDTAFLNRCLSRSAIREFDTSESPYWNRDLKITYDAENDLYTYPMATMKNRIPLTAFAGAF